MTRRSRTVARPCVLLLIATAVVGCGPAPVSAPRPSPTTTIGFTTPVPPYAGAPAVPDPLPSTVLAGDPCTTALTRDQVKQFLGIAATGRLDRGESRGPVCLWANPVTARTIGVAYATTPRQGLSAVYPSPGLGEGWVWRELTVAGFPAVATTLAPRWYCTVTVGLADDTAVGVSLVGRVGDYRDVCAATGQTAGLVVATVRQGAGR